MFHAQLEQTDDEVVVNILYDETTSVIVDTRCTVVLLSQKMKQERHM